MEAQLRYRRAALTSIANVGSKGAALLLTLASVRFTVPYLGPERFGMWMTVVSLYALAGVLDFGFGNALTNRIARASASGEQVVRTEISNGLYWICVIALGVGVILYAGAALVPIDWITKNGGAREEVRSSLVILALLFPVSTVTTTLQRIYLGLQRAYYVHVLATLGSLAALLALYLATRVHASLPQLILVTIGVQTGVLLGLVAPLVHLKLLSHGAVRHLDVGYARTVWRTGLQFLVLQIGAIIASGLDNAIVTATAGAGATAIFAITQRVFQIASQAFAVCNAPLWPAYAEAHARGDSKFIAVTLRKSLLWTTIGMAIICFALVLFGNSMAKFLSGGSLVTTRELLGVLAVWTLVEAVNVACAMFLNGIGLLTPQIVGFAGVILVGLPAKWIASSLGGPVAMISVFTAVYAASFIFSYLMLFRRSVSCWLHSNAPAW